MAILSQGKNVHQHRSQNGRNFNHSDGGFGLSPSALKGQRPERKKDTEASTRRREKERGRVSPTPAGARVLTKAFDRTQPPKSYCGVNKVSPIPETCFWEEVCLRFFLVSPVWQRGPGTKLKTRGREGEKYKKGDFGSELVAFNIIRA